MRRILLFFILTACTSSSQSAKPIIQTFTASPNPITFGQSTTLSWEVKGNDVTLTLDQGIGKVTSALTVTPNTSTTYTLKASNAQGQANQSVTVHVQSESLRAFPGAEGFGATASGGRGGKVIYVTNLNASGPGSLQAALDEDGARTILFKVSGIIEGVPIVTKGNFTLAGQTSPGGIILRGLMIQGDVVCEEDGCPLPTEAPENFIVRFVRLRNPLPDGADGDGLRLHRAKYGIIDHVSIGGATDEAVQISFSSDITVQNTLLAETVGGHADYGGMLINYSDPTRGYPLTRLSIHHNVWNRIVGRLPELSRENPSAAGSTMELELSNNLWYDPGAAVWFSNCSTTDGAPNGYQDNPVYYQANIIGNVSWQNPAREQSFGSFTMECAATPSEGYLPTDTPTRFFMQDNHSNLHPKFTDYQLFYCCNDFAQTTLEGVTFPDYQAGFAASSRLTFPEITYTPAEALLEYALANVGAFPRDAMDRRLMGFVESRTFDNHPRDSNPANDALMLDFSAVPEAPIDSDNDGMPDAWEIKHGLAPETANPNGTDLSSQGYTNLEVYLNELALERSRP